MKPNKLETCKLAAKHHEPWILVLILVFGLILKLVAVEGRLQGSYRVYQEPVESPSHGERALVADPDNPMASPQGWHDGTTTTGPNADVFWDRDNNGTPDGRPTGTNLTFDFPLNLGDGSPEDNRDAIASNTFYWVNRIHDLLYLKGFTPDYGNFQDDDPFLVSLQTNGSNSENTPATLTVPADGSSPRLTLHEWSYRFPNIVELDDQDIVFNGFASHAEFGDPQDETGINGEIIYVGDAIGGLHEACGPDFNNDLTGKIALVDRGGCGYVTKAENIQNAGAITMIVINLPGEEEPEDMTGISPVVTIPTVMIGYNDGQNLIAALGSEPVTATVRLATFPNRDAGLDGGTLAYYYGAATAQRMVGINCLDHPETPRLGWAAFLALALTQPVASTPTRARGIGSYKTYNHPGYRGAAPFLLRGDGTGQGLSYDAMGSFTTAEEVGSVWAASLWDLYWNMVAEYGYNPNLDEQEGGNNQVIRLVIEAMRQTPCEPTFVAARNALIVADGLLNGGVNRCYIWQAFAGHGLGEHANAGSPDLLSDNLASSVEPARALVCGNDYYSRSMLVRWGEKPRGCVCESGTSNRVDVTELVASIEKTPYIHIDRRNIDENPPLGTLIGRLSILPDAFARSGPLRFEIIGQSQIGAVALQGDELRVANPAAFNHEEQSRLVVQVLSNVSEYITVMADLRITVNDLNEAPQLDTLIPNQTIPEGEPVNLNLADYFSDPDVGEVLSFTATGLPPTLNISGAGMLTGTLAYFSDPLVMTVTATDSSFSVSDTFQITVLNINDSPEVDSQIPNKNVTEDTAFSIDLAPHFRDIDGDVLTFSVSALPDTMSLSAVGVLTGTPDNDDALSSHDAPFIITVSATDPHNVTASDTFELTVTNTNDPPEVVTLIPNTNAMEDSAFSYGITNNFRDIDPGPDTLTFTATGLPDSLNISAAGVITGTPNNADALGSPYVVAVTATDSGNLTGSDTFQINVANVNDAPLLVTPSPNVSATEDAAFSLNVAPNFSDPDGDTLTFTATGLPPSLTINGAGLITGTPVNADSLVETFVFTVTASDTSMASVTDTVQLTVINTNDPPLLNPLIPNTAGTQGTPFALSISDHFSDPDPNPGTLTFTATGLPASGTITINSVGIIFGTFNSADALGSPYVVVATATDPGGLTASDTFQLTVTNVNDAPVLDLAIVDQAANEDDLFTLNVAPNFSDIDLDTLSFSANGLPAVMSISGAGVISGTPTNTDLGMYNVTVTATDPDGLFANDTFNLNVINAGDAPTVVTTIPNTNATEDTAFALNIAGNFGDVDPGDVLTFTATGLPPNIMLSTAGAFTGTPTNADALLSPFTVTVTARDTFLLFVEDTFQLTVANTNDAPELVSLIPNASVTEDMAFNLDVAAHFNDPDPNPGVLTFTAVGLPASLGISGAGVISGTPVNDDFLNGPFVVTVTATDPSTANVSDIFQLTVANVNDTPVVDTLILNTNATEDMAFILNIAGNFSDPDGDALTFTAMGLPANLNISAAGVITGTARNVDFLNGPFIVTVTASDPSTASVDDLFQLTVINTNDQPVLDVIIPNTSGTEDTGFSLNVAPYFSDEDGDDLTFTAIGLPASGNLVLSGAGVIAGTPRNADALGSPFVVTITASDGGLFETDVFQLTIINVNDPPELDVAVADANATQDVVFNLNVAANFSDPDGDTLTFTATGLPQSLSISSAGLITGTPNNADVNGSPYTIIITASDTSFASISDTFSLAVGDVCDRPELDTALTDRNATEDLLFSLDVSGNFSDPDGDNLAFSATGLPPTLTISPVGVISGTPDNDDFLNGPIYIVTVTTSDSCLLNVADTFMLTVLNTNDAPVVATIIPNVMTVEDTPFSFFVANNFSDPDGDTLTFTATGLPPTLTISAAGVITGTTNNDDVLNSPFVVVVTASDPSSANVADTFQLGVNNVNDAPVVREPIFDTAATENAFLSLDVSGNFEDPDGDTLTFTATGLLNTLNISATGVISGTPTAWETVAVTVTATDPSGLSVGDTFNLKINAIPVLVTQIPDQTANLGTFFSLDVSGHFNDPDGDSLTFTTYLPQVFGITMSSEGVISGTPVYARQPPYNIGATVVASDPFGESATDTFTIVVNAAPFLTQTPSPSEDE